MGFLVDPETTTSYQSWRDITGCTCVLVQARTGSGLKKNNTIFHKIAYSQTDLEPYRIIIVDPSDTRVTFTENGPGTKDHNSDEPLKNANKYVLASASTESEVLHLWEVMRKHFKIPFCGSVSAQHAAAAAGGSNNNNNNNVKRDAVKEVRIASAILPGWSSFVQSPMAKAAPQQVAKNQQLQQQQQLLMMQQEQENQEQQNNNNNNNNARTVITAESVPASSPLSASPVASSSQRSISSSFPTPTNNNQSSFTSNSSAPQKNISNNNTTSAAPSSSSSIVDTTAFSVEEIIGREFVVKELPTIERSLARACLRVQPDRPAGFVYIALLTLCYTYARMTQTSALFDVTVLILFFWHCRVRGDGSSSSSSSSSNQQKKGVEEALEREREVDALGGLGRLVNIFSLSHPPSAVAFWVVAHFVAVTYYPDVMPNGIWPLVQGMTLPCAVAALLLAPHIGPVVRPASAEEFETDEQEVISSSNQNHQLGMMTMTSQQQQATPAKSSSAPLPNDSNNSPSPVRTATTTTAANNNSMSAVDNNSRSRSRTDGSLPSLTQSFGPGNASFARSPMPATTRRCLQLWKSGGAWKLTKERDNVLYRTKPVPWCKPLAIWLTTTIPNVRATDIEAILCDDTDGSNKSSFAFQFDKMMDFRFRAAELQVEPWFEHVWCTRFKTPIFTVKPRELSTKVAPIYYLTLEQQRRWGIESDTGVVYTFCGFQDPHDTVPLDSKYERGMMHCYGMFAVENGGGVILHQILSVDLGGYLPSWIVNLTNDEQIDRCSIIRQLAMKHARTGKLKLQVGPRRPAACYDAEAARMLGLDFNNNADRQLIESKLTLDEENGYNVVVSNNNNKTSSSQQQQQQQQQSSSVPATTKVYPVREKGQPVPSALQKAIQLLHANDWNVVKKTDDGIEYSTKPSPFCNKVAVRLHAKFPSSTGIRACDVHEVLNDDPHGKTKTSTAFKYDRLLSERICLKHVSENIQHWRTCYKSPVWGVKARDMCTIYNTFFADPEEASKTWGIAQAAAADTANNGQVFIIAAEDNGKNVPEDSNFSRGAVHVYFILAVDTPTGLDMTTVLSVDPQGMIPASLVDATNLEQIEKLKFQRELFKEQAEKRKRLEATAAAAAVAASANPNNNNNNNNNSNEPPQAKLPETLLKAIKLYREASWKLVTEKNGVKFSDAASPFCNKKATFYELFIPGITADDVDAIVNDDPRGTNPNANSYTYDRLLTKRICVSEEDSKSDGQHYVTWRTLYKSPVWGIAARDFVFRTSTLFITSKAQQEQLGFVADGENGKVWAFSADNRGDTHPVDSAFTRGALHCFAIMAIETGGGCRLVQIGSFDPQGMIPASVIDATNAEQIEKLLIMKRLMQQRANGRK